MKSLYLRIGQISMRVICSNVTLILALCLIIFLVFVLSLTGGAFEISTHDIVDFVGGKTTEEISFVIGDLKLPRSLGALLAGGILALGGLFFQVISRNPLVSPDLVGVNSGASFGVVLALSMNLGTSAAPAFSAIGGLSAAILVFGFASSKSIGVQKLIIGGIAVNTLGSSFVNFILPKLHQSDAQAAYQWMSGSLLAISNEDLVWLALVLSFGALTAVSMTRTFRIVQLEELEQRSMGLRPSLVRFVTLAIGTLITSGAVSVVGPISYLALLVPPLARHFTRTLGFSTILVCILIGGFLVLISDLTTRSFFEGQIPLGLMTTFIGSPLFLWAIVRRRNQ